MFLRANELAKLLSELHAYVKKVPVVGFNTQKYDINVMKAELFRQLQMLDNDDDGEIVTDDDEIVMRSGGFIVKKNNTFPCVETGRLRFLVICNFIAHGYSYEKYLKAYKCEQQKGFFPYEWMDGLHKLKDVRLPPREAFYSRLKMKGISEEDYAYCQAEWTRHNMNTVEDFLIWYNNGDVEPFVKAIERQRTMYKDKGIDMLKEAISLPGLAVRWMFKEAPRERPRDDGDFSVGCLVTAFRTSAPVCLLDERNSDMYALLKKQPRRWVEHRVSQVSQKGSDEHSLPTVWRRRETVPIRKGCRCQCFVSVVHDARHANGTTQKNESGRVRRHHVRLQQSRPQVVELQSVEGRRRHSPRIERWRSPSRKQEFASRRV